MYTPSSVSEEKVPMNNLVTVLVSSADKSGKLEDPTITEGKIFISFTGDVDSTLSSGVVRGMMLDKAVSVYNDQHKNNPINITAAQRKAFTETNMIGAPFKALPALLDMSVTERDKIQGDLTREDVGIPIDGNQDKNNNLNDFQVWCRAIYLVAKDIHDDKAVSAGLTPDEAKALEDLYNAVTKDGRGIAIKADKDTPFTTVEMVFDNLQTMNLNKFSLMTALTSEDEATAPAK